MSAYSEFDRLMNTLRVRLPGAIDAAIRLELFNTIDDFLRRSNAWRYFQSIPIVAGQTNYAISPPNGTVMVRTIAATQNGVPVQQMSGSSEYSYGVGAINADALSPSGDATFNPDVLGGPPANYGYAVYYPSYVVINLPDGSGQVQYPFDITMAISLDPEVLTDEDMDNWPLDAWMFTSFFEVWMDGCIGRMMSTINKPYYNLKMAEYHMRRFRGACGYHRQEADKGFVYNAQPWRFPGGWR